MSTARRLIFQLGTNNWQGEHEFAPGSGILHAAHHDAFNQLSNTRAVSMWPSRTQRVDSKDVRVFELEHDIPICESISPVSSYRWHSMSDDEFSKYRERLADAVYDFMADVETEEGAEFTLAIAHHTFLNPIVMRDVIRRRMAEGKSRTPMLCFAHGTALKMFVQERAGTDPEQFPARFLPLLQSDGIFDLLRVKARGPDARIDACAAISTQQVEHFLDMFPSYPRDQVLLSPNGYNQEVFQRIREPADVYATREAVLARFTTAPYEGSRHAPRAVTLDRPIEKVVVFCGKFADWKRLDTVLHAAKTYEAAQPGVVTLVVGSGPHADQVRLQDLAFETLGLKNVFFVGPRQQDELAILFNTGDIGVFPSYQEPFGLVFIECMACGTPVIGANSGGPRDFVTDDVGTLVPETDDRDALAASLAATILRSFTENWKGTKGPTAEQRALKDFSVRTQCADLLGKLDTVLAQSDDVMRAAS